MSSTKAYGANVITFWEEHFLYTTVDVKIIKNVFTLGFVVLGVAINLAGAFYLKRRNLGKLNNKSDEERVVPLTWMTSWLGLTPTLKYYWKTKRLPGGSFGLMMVITGIFGVAHPFFVNSFVTSTTIYTPQVCEFNYGIISTADNSTVLPLSTFACATTVYDAQLNAFTNSAQYWGIWRKVDYISDTFYPLQDDLLGSWDCKVIQNIPIDLTPFANITSDQFVPTVDAILAEQNFLYSEVRPATISSFGATTAFLAWSADQPNDSNTTWNVRASISNNLATTKTANITNLECNLQTNVTDWTPTVMPSNQTLLEWGPTTFGFLMNADPSEFWWRVVWKLNAMSMIAGTGNNDLQNVTALPEGETHYYGCLLPATSLNPGIWAVLAVVVLLLVVISTAALFIFLFHFFKARKTAASARDKLVKDTPAGLDDFQMFVIKEVTGDDTITIAQAKDYSYGWNDIKGAYVFARNDEFKTGVFAPSPLDSSPHKQDITYTVSPADSPPRSANV